METLRPHVGIGHELLTEQKWSVVIWFQGLTSAGRNLARLVWLSGKAFLYFPLVLEWNTIDPLLLELF